MPNVLKRDKSHSLPLEAKKKLVGQLATVDSTCNRRQGGSFFVPEYDLICQGGTLKTLTPNCSRAKTVRKGGELRRVSYVAPFLWTCTIMGANRAKFEGNQVCWVFRANLGAPANLVLFGYLKISELKPCVPAAVCLFIRCAHVAAGPCAERTSATRPVRKRRTTGGGWDFPFPPTVGGLCPHRVFVWSGIYGCQDVEA